ncbi:hypothetical protein ACGFY6_33395 [Streptomyces sp. NPDC048387]|uniref:hypothetical protein n=1 Tax=Streptomyces sp. NPDC048387 TaxID=3365542 RepID=UPI003718D962
MSSPTTPAQTGIAPRTSDQTAPPEPTTSGDYELAPPAPRAQAVPTQPSYAPDTAPVPAGPAPEADQEEAESVRRERPERVPGGPLLLSVVNAAGLAGTSAYYAAGVAGAVVLGGAAVGAGAVGTAYAFRRATRGGFRRGMGYGGLYPGRWGRRGDARRTGLGVGSGGFSSGGAGGRRGRAGGSLASGAPVAGGGWSRRAARRAAAASATGTVGAAAGRPPGRKAPGAPSGSSAGSADSGRRRGAGWLRGAGTRAAGRDATGRGTAAGRSGAGRGGVGQSTAAARRRAGAGTTTAQPGTTRGRLARTAAWTGRQLAANAGRVKRGTVAAGGWVGRGLRAARDNFPKLMGKAGRGLAGAWRGTRTARRAARAKLRYARRVSLTLLLAALAGIVGKALRPFTWGSGKALAVRVWNWRANRIRPKEDAQRAKEAAADAADTRAPVRDTVDDPGTAVPGQGGAPAGAPGSGGSNVHQVFARAAEAVATAYGAYSPPSMLAVAAEYEGLPEGIRHAAMAIRHLALNTEQVYPAHKSVVESVSSVYTALAAAADAADEIHGTFREAHEADLARHEAPRNGYSGEVMWNIGGKPGDSGTAHQSVFSRSCEAVATVYATYQPGVMTEVGQEYACLPDGIEHLASAVQSLAVHSADSYPVKPVIAEMVAGVHHHLKRAVSAASDVLPVFRRAHELDLSRHEAPRNGVAAEAMWNV